MKGVICGKGGQGVITLNRILGIILSNYGEKVISAETHGMAMRGGSVSTFLKIGDFCSANFGSKEADFIISTDKDEFLLNIHFLKSDGVAIVNGCKKIEHNDAKIVNIDATNFSLKLFNNPKYANWFLIFSFFNVFKDRFDMNKIIKIISDNRMLDRNMLEKILEGLK